ncbi:hypothetical protein HanPSC8_Chr14g0624721 [Helianthus annuus]|nr:hypothetical protein HanPSC8_Chr14g0624721 [Helianthus annuus]
MCLTAKLSQKSCVALFCSTFSSFRSHRSQRISLTVDAMARYSASAEDETPPFASLISTTPVTRLKRANNHSLIFSCRGSRANPSRYTRLNLSLPL